MSSLNEECNFHRPLTVDSTADTPNVTSNCGNNGFSNNNRIVTAATASETLSSSSSGVKVPVIVRTTGTSSSTITTSTLGLSASASVATANSNNTSANTNSSNSNKKHNLGYHIRRLLFPQFRSTTGTTLSKHRTNTKDVEANNENQIFLKHSTSLYSTSSGGEGTDPQQQQHYSRRSSGSKSHRRTCNRAQQTDTLPEYPSLTHPPLGSSLSRSSFVSALPSPRPTADGLLECSICLLEQALTQFPELCTCHHRVCLTCLRQYLRIEILESRVNITCPECTEQLHPNDIKLILRNDLNLADKYESFMVRRILITDPDARWCPAPDCDYCVIASGCASCPKLRCERPGCETLFCYHCKQEWHPNQTCDQARAQRGRSSKATGVTFGSSNRSTDSALPGSSGDIVLLQRDDIKPCPCCKVLIIKMDDGSCNHMTCSVCGTEFCWLCMQKISDLHYLSPSGCTFWGKKPWSRKKKILWQLGMLVGAPVGIALIAGIAVPAIIIGIPVWVGRKLYARFERNRLSRPKSNLLVTTGVLTSIFVSPILAAVAVGIGVPILLAYVYGVVPISLCRSGGCGVSTSSSGVRIELDEDEISANAAADGISVDTALSGLRGIGNPSIGEVSLGMSIAACAGSIASSMATATNASANVVSSSSHANNKLETQADIISNKRFSFSSQNADAISVTFSFGDRSINTNVSSVDDSSLKALNGSIRDGPSQSNANYSLSPVEVHVNICEDKELTVPIAANKCYKSTQTKAAKHVAMAVVEPTVINTSQPTGSATILGKFESRSLEYLSGNYCKICHKSHKPCCPNFQHPNGGTIKLNKFMPENVPTNTLTDATDSTSGPNDFFAVCVSGDEVAVMPESEHGEQTKSKIVIDCCDNQSQQPQSQHSPQQKSSSSSDPIARNALSKKAFSQIVLYPSNGAGEGSINNENRSSIGSMKMAKSSTLSNSTRLSHSVSFTHQSVKNNLITETNEPSYML